MPAHLVEPSARRHIRLSHLLVLCIAALAPGQATQPATAPGNPLLGRWRLLGMGDKRLPDGVQIFWVFDARRRTVTAANGDVATVCHYVLRADGERQIIILTEAGRTEPYQAGLWKIDGDRLRVQIASFTDKAPTTWDEKETIHLARDEP